MKVNIGILNRHVAEQEEIELEFVQHAQIIYDLKGKLRWLVKICKLSPHDSRCTHVYSEIKACEWKMRVSNERHRQVKLLLHQQSHGTLFQSKMQPTYSQSVGLGERCLKTEIDEFSILDVMLQLDPIVDTLSYF
jgi:hypothetical protein